MAKKKVAQNLHLYILLSPHSKKRFSAIMWTSRHKHAQKNETQGTSRKCLQMFAQPIMAGEKVRKNLFVGDGSQLFQALLCTITALICQAKSVIANETKKLRLWALELGDLRNIVHV